MPIYEYRCSACGHKLESLQRLSDAPLLTCPACGKDALTKLVSAAGFQLKGSGWYATDFKNSGAKPPAKDAAKPEAESDAKSENGAGASEGKSESSTKADAPAASSSAKEGPAAKTEAQSAADKPVASGGSSGGT